MRYRLNHIIAAAIAAAVISSCGQIGDYSVETAENEFQAGRYESAQTLCDSLILGQQFSDLSIDELCRLSMLTSRLADLCDEETNMALAARCMQAALQREPDSVLIFVHSLPADEQSRTLFIRQLTRTVDPSCEPDTVTIPVPDDTIDIN